MAEEPDAVISAQLAEEPDAVISAQLAEEPDAVISAQLAEEPDAVISAQSAEEPDAVISAQSAEEPDAVISAPTTEHDPCAYLDEPFDVVSTASNETMEETAEMRFSGHDKYLLRTIRNRPDNSVLFKQERIYKDGTLYIRNTEDDPNVFGDWEIAGTGASGRATLPCLLPASSYARSADTPPDAPHHVSHTFLSDQRGSLQEEYWVDDLGRPTRSRQTFYPPDADSREGSGDRSASEASGVVNFTFSGFSEPNIITAPIATPTPTPTPAPH